MEESEGSGSGNNQSYSSSSSSSGSAISNMAQDYLFTILLLLPIDAILSLSMTCKRFRALSSSHTLWRSLCKRDFGSTCVDSLLNSSNNNQHHHFPWMRLYKQVSLMDSVCCHKLLVSDLDFPAARASHSLNFVSDCLVLFGGGCEGGWLLSLSFHLSTKLDSITVRNMEKRETTSVLSSTTKGIQFNTNPFLYGFIIMPYLTITSSAILVASYLFR